MGKEKGRMGKENEGRGRKRRKRKDELRKGERKRVNGK
jgi:hypothetical protein